MNINEAVAKVEEIADCCTWKPNADASASFGKPADHIHFEYAFYAGRDLYDDTSDALCRMFLSTMQAEVIKAKARLELVEIEGNPKICWRVVPKIEKNWPWGKGIDMLYVRFTISSGNKSND